MFLDSILIQQNLLSDKDSQHLIKIKNNYISKNINLVYTR